MNLEKLVKERIENNKNIFSKNELILLNNYASITKKVYLVGVMDGKIFNESGQKSGQYEENNCKTFQNKNL